DRPKKNSNTEKTEDRPKTEESHKTTQDRPKNISKFIFLLHRLVCSNDHPSLSWIDENSFAIQDRSIFEREILPILSKSHEFSGFIRQLNGYGFKKQPGKIPIYKNENFTYDGKNLFKMKRINKKINDDQNYNNIQEETSLIPHSDQIFHSYNNFIPQQSVFQNFRLLDDKNYQK
ncbi:putative heat shock transcription factor, partial [Pseudoloma neurophilia]